MSTDTAIDRVQVHLRESSQLLHLFESLAKDDWDKRSDCDLWSIADVAAHLASGHRGRAEAIGRGINGEPPTPPPGYNMAPSGPAREQVIAERAIAIKAEHHGRLVGYFKDSAQQLNDVLLRINPQTLENPCWHGRGIRSVRAYINLAIAEQAMHARDVRVGLTKDARLNPEAIPAFLYETSRWWGIVFKPENALSSAVRYRFRLIEPIEQTVDLVVTGDECYVALAEDKQCDVEFHCDSETYVLMAYGRVSRAQAIKKGRLTQSRVGDPKQISMFDSWF